MYLTGQKAASGNNLIPISFENAAQREVPDGTSQRVVSENSYEVFFGRSLRSEMRINVRKKAAAYHVSRSAVKNVHVAKSGIARTRHTSPVQIRNRGLRKNRSATNTIRKKISCGFMIFSRK